MLLTAEATGRLNVDRKLLVLTPGRSFFLFPRWHLLVMNTLFSDSASLRLLSSEASKSQLRVRPCWPLANMDDPLGYLEMHSLTLVSYYQSLLCRDDTYISA